MIKVNCIAQGSDTRFIFKFFKHVQLLQPCIIIVANKRSKPVFQINMYMKSISIFPRILSPDP